MLTDNKTLVKQLSSIGTQTVVGFSEMQLSSIQPHPSGALLLLLLLMCENVASAPRCIIKNGGCQEVFKHMFNMTRTTSESISHLSSETLKEFDSQYDSGQKFQNKPTMSCHTASQSIPNSKKKAQRMQPLALISVTIRMLAAWKNLLYHVKDSMADLDETPYAIISKVALIDGQIRNLTENLQDIKTILSQVSPEHKENENYPTWTGEPYIQQFRGEVDLFGLHSLFFCLHSDAQKVSDFVSILRHQVLPNE